MLLTLLFVGLLTSAKAGESNIELDVQIRVYVCHNENTVELEMLIVELVVRAVCVMDVQGSGGGDLNTYHGQ